MRRGAIRARPSFCRLERATYERASRFHEPFIFVRRGAIRARPSLCRLERVTYEQASRFHEPFIFVRRGAIRGRPSLCCLERVTYEQASRFHEPFNEQKNAMRLFYLFGRRTIHKHRFIIGVDHESRLAFIRFFHKFPLAIIHGNLPRIFSIGIISAQFCGV